MFQTTNQKLTCPWLVFIWLCPRVVVLHPNVRQMIKNHWTLWPFWGISHIWCKVLPQHRGARSEDYHRLSDWEAKAHASQGLDGFRRCILCAYLKIPEPSEDPRHKTFCSQCRRSAAHNRPQLLHMDVHPLGPGLGPSSPALGENRQSAKGPKKMSSLPNPPNLPGDVPSFQAARPVFQSRAQGWIWNGLVTDSQTLWEFFNALLWKISKSSKYPLVNIQKTMERFTIFNGKIHENPL